MKEKEVKNLEIELFPTNTEGILAFLFKTLLFLV